MTGEVDLCSNRQLNASSSYKNCWPPLCFIVQILYEWVGGWGGYEIGFDKGSFFYFFLKPLKKYISSCNLFIFKWSFSVCNAIKCPQKFKSLSRVYIVVLLIGYFIPNRSENWKKSAVLLIINQDLLCTLAEPQGHACTICFNPSGIIIMTGAKVC